MSRYTQEYMEKMKEFVIGEEMKLKRTKGEKDKTKPLGVGHLSDEAKGTSVKEGKREYASATISKADEKGTDEKMEKLYIVATDLIEKLNDVKDTHEIMYLDSLLQAELDEISDIKEGRV